MKCVLPGRGIKGDYCFLFCCYVFHTVFAETAFGKAIFCLAKLGDDLYIEAQNDGVSLLK